MDFITLVFRLGVVLAIFSFIWGLLRLGFTVLRGGVPLTYPIALALKMVQYFLIADITVLFCENKSDALPLDLVLSGLILLMYFVGKVQNMKNRFMIVQFQNRSLRQTYQPKMRLEFAVIALGMGLFIFLAINPDYAVNPMSQWFYTNITEIEKAPVFGFIFKIVGFFFTLSILFRLAGAFTILLSGQAFNGNGNQGTQNGGSQRDDDDFDDYEEIR